MTSLRNTQKAFMEALFGRSPEQFEALIQNGRFPARDLTQVYRNNLFISLTEALSAVYPVVEKLVGKEFFGYLANEYIHNHPSTSGDIHAFGNSLPEFITSFSACDGLPYLSDVADLEWAWHEVFHEKADPPVDLSRLASIPEQDTPGLRFRFQTACRLLHSEFPTLAIWQANQQDKVAEVSLDAGATWLAIVQKNLQPVCVRLSKAEFQFLGFLQLGMNLDRAAERITRQLPDFDLDLADILYRFVQHQLITDFE